MSIDGMTGEELSNDPKPLKATYRFKPGIQFDLHGSIRAGDRILWVIVTPDGEHLKITDEFFKQYMERV